ncbi:MAG: hypothetical protein ACFHU9_02915 [Fluviicola sp.]
MKFLSIVKHILTALLLAALVLGLIQLFTLDVSQEKFGDQIISGTFLLSFFVLLATYRIDWIGKQKINWISFLLFILSLAGLLTMLAYPKNVMALWKPTIAAYILLCGFVFFQKITGNNWSTLLARGFLSITAGLFLYPLLIQTTSSAYYQIAGTFLICTGFVSLVNILIPVKKR